jgi:hypothetical protein
MKRRFATLAALIALSGPAAAQVDGWVVITEADDPNVIALAMHCPVYDAAAERAFCLAIGCTPDDPFSFGFSFTGFDRPGGIDFEATYTVDGLEYDPVAMRLIGLGTFETIAAAYDERRHANLLEALRQGLNMEVRFDGDALPPQRFPLNRSLVSIDRARAICDENGDTHAGGIVGQRVDAWDMVNGDADDDHYIDLLPDGVLRITLNGAVSESAWTVGSHGEICMTLPGYDEPGCGLPEITGRDLSLRLGRADGSLLTRLVGEIGPIPE